MQLTYVKNKKKVLKNLLREVEETYIKDVFHKFQYEEAAKALYEYNPDLRRKWEARFDEVESELRGLQGQEEEYQKMSARQEYKDEKIGEIAEQKKPLIDEIRELHEKLEKIGEFEKKANVELPKKLAEMELYMLLLKKFISEKLYDRYFI